MTAAYDPANFAESVATALCADGMQPTTLNGFFRDFLVRHFADVRHLRLPELRHLIWADGDTTNIQIESVHRWTPRQTEKRPAVLFKRGAYKNYQAGINNALGSNRQGQDEHSTFWIGSHTVFCLNTAPQAAELLTQEVRRQLCQLAPPLRHNLGLLKLQVQEVGELFRVKESQTHFAAAITVGWAFEETWTVEEESLPLAGISLKTVLEM